MHSGSLAPTNRANKTPNAVKQCWAEQIALKIKSPILPVFDADHRPIPHYG
jgi:hypothetical protein